MNQELWRRAEDLFHAALERAPETRRAFLDEACGEDSDLRRQVATLVSNAERAESFLETAVFAGVEPTKGPRASLVGQQIGPYRIHGLLGAGGMGEVYRASDDRLGRDVAIKTLPPEFARDAARLERLRREARLLASLNHPNIAAIYGLEESTEAAHLVLEMVEGDTPRGPLPLGAALDIARQVAAALQAAHERGIVHRDMKPANLRVTPQGIVKVLDFGLAKAIWGTACEPHVPLPATPPGVGTATGLVLGTPGYTSPEQARGQEVDQRTDVWSFGCVLYELLTGRRAFEGQAAAETLAAVLEGEPDWQALPAETPARVRELLRKCLHREVGARLQSMTEVRTAIEEVQRRRSRSRSLVLRARQPGFAIPALAVPLLAGLLGLWLYRQNSRARWVREQAIPEISRALDAGELQQGFRLLRRAEAILPGDPTLQRIHEDSGIDTSFDTSPPGAEVWATGYAPGDDDWLRLGTTPFTTRALWLGFYRFRVVKPGFRTALGAREVRGGSFLRWDLDAEGATPSDMVRVAGGAVNVPGLGDAQVGAFLIDRYEITNRQFRRFVDQGGYRSRQFWKEAFVQSGHTRPWDEAMRSFLDTTGRPGPATWKLGTYPSGQDEYPVGGVSWYEAAAYAEFAGKQLPTIYHWQQAASPGWFVDVTAISNFGGTGPARVGEYKGLGAFGTLDMAGNVREWCRNEESGRRCVRGGAWDEPSYLFAAPDARDPWDRSPQNGIRCVRYDARAESGLGAPVTRPPHDRAKQTPVSDDVFRLYRSLFSYDPSDLDARVEGIDQENSIWKREKLSFAGPDGGERVPAYLYLPKGVTPPYQTILYAEAGMALRLPSPQPGEERLFDFVVKSGRALLRPVLKGQYQRRYAAPPAGLNAFRDRLVAESKEFRRSIDYLVSRKDVDAARLGVYGLSRGLVLPVLAVGETRLKVAALASVGLTAGFPLPEIDPVNFLPRFTVPTLMVCGRSDFVFPPESSQLPMFRLLGAREEDKRLRQWDGGHMPPSFEMPIREILDWFDRYLGPVQGSAAPRADPRLPQEAQ
jgi:serine/threonine protein kinase